MSDIPTDVKFTVEAFTSWARALVARQTALEALVKERLNISEPEWKKLVSDAHSQTHSWSVSSGSLSTLAEFLQGLSRPK